MNTTKSSLSFFHKTLYYIVLYGFLFQFVAFPAYVIRAHFPYGTDSTRHLTFIRSEGKTTTIDDEEAKPISESSTIKTINNKSSEENLAFELPFLESFGVIGYNNESNSDDPADNIFTINLDKTKLEGGTLQLNYEVFGIENVSGIARSINEHTATGGFFIQRNNEWNQVQEIISIEQLKQGQNYILFTATENRKLNYKIRNVNLKFLPATDTKLVSIADGDRLYVNEGKAYVKGSVLKNDVQLHINGRHIPVRGGEFETLIENASKIQSLNIELKQAGHTVYYDDVPIKFIQEVSEVVTYKSPAVKIPVREASDGSFGFALANVDLNITKENYEHADRITVQKLRDVDVAPVGTNIINVTAKAAAYRFLPDGAKFNEPVRITLKYDEKLLPKGYSASDVKVLYFDINQRRWLSVPTDSIIADEHKIVGLTDHFTDYIAGVIQAPESPETNAFTPTSISDIQVANPTANIMQMQPPVANQQGDGTVEFPITVPSARSGLQPNLSVSYNNNGSGGIVGQGWNIDIPHISVDTRFGVPTYDPYYETESYLLNGEELLLAPYLAGDNYLPHRNSTLTARRPDAIFIPKVQSSFSRIIRKGTSPSNYYWEVWDKSGTKYTYGVSGDIEVSYGYIYNHSNDAISSILKSSPSDPIEKRAKWYLTEVRDKNDNLIIYNYKTKTPPLSGPLKDGVEVYLYNIIYNLNANAFPKKETPEQDRDFTVSFLYKNEVRADAQTNYRYGFKENSSMLLDKINVSCVRFQDGNGGLQFWDPSIYGGRIYPCDNEIEYQFTYEPSETEGAFNKTMLTKITTSNIKIDMSTAFAEETQKYDHQFEYYNDILGGLFTNPESIFIDKDFSGDKHSVLSSTIEDFSSSFFGVSAGISSATQPPVWWPFSNSGTINFSFPSPTSTSSSPSMILMDIDGDGLDDKVMQIGNQIKYRKNLAGIAFSKQLYTAYNINDLGLSESNTKTDPELSFSLLFMNLTSSKSQSNSRSRSYFVDVNNDGLIDYVKDKIVYFNRMDPNSGMPSFTANSGLTPNAIIKEAQVDTSVSQGLPDFNIDEGLMDVVKVWVAPKDGDVNITGSITKPFVASHNGVRYSIEHGKESIAFSTFLINPTLLVNATHQTNVYNVAVEKGDHIYFRVNSSQLPDEQVTADWNPHVIYTDSSNGSSFDESFLFGDAQAVPAIIKEPGEYVIEWTSSNVSLSGGINLTVSAYQLNPNNVSSPRTNVLTYTQTVTNWLNYQQPLLTINANNVYNVYSHNLDMQIKITV